MHHELVSRHNELVKEDDLVIHCGDFCLGKNRSKIKKLLNGRHIFLAGSHDRGEHEIFETGINGYWVVACHYPLRVWARSHFNSFHVFAHAHRKLDPIGKSWDVGVDNNNFYPVSENRLIEIMATRPNNPNYILDRKAVLSGHELHK